MIYKYELLRHLHVTNILITFVISYVTYMNTRLKQFLAAENISQAQFADNINVVRASVSHVLSGRNNPSYEFIRSVMLKYPLLNIEWLMFGKGRMYKDKSGQEEDKSEDLLFPEQTLFAEKKDIPVQVDEPELPVRNTVETAASQRKVSKIIVLFDDGTFQEM